MKWKDRPVEVKPFKEILSRLGMARYRLVFRYMRRGLTIIRIWLEWVKLKNRTLGIWNTTWAWQSNKGMHISVIRSYLFLNFDIYPSLIASPDMISLKGLTSAALPFHFMINCQTTTSAHENHTRPRMDARTQLSDTTGVDCARSFDRQHPPCHPTPNARPAMPNNLTDMNTWRRAVRDGQQPRLY